MPGWNRREETGLAARPGEHIIRVCNGGVHRDGRGAKGSGMEAQCEQAEGAQQCPAARRANDSRSPKTPPKREAQKNLARKAGVPSGDGPVPCTNTLSKTSHWRHVSLLEDRTCAHGSYTHSNIWHFGQTQPGVLSFYRFRVDSSDFSHLAPRDRTGRKRRLERFTTEAQGVNRAWPSFR